MSYKLQKEYSLHRVVVKVPKDCGTGIAFWINQQVASVIDNIPMRIDERVVSSHKLSDKIEGTLGVDTYGQYETKECGHTEWVRKDTGYLLLEYYFGDSFLLTDLDFVQNCRSEKNQHKANLIVQGYAKLISNALAASGIETKVYVKVVKHYYTPSCKEEYCSYCATDRRHKAHTRTVNKKRVGPSFIEWTGFEEINLPVPAEIAEAA